MKQLRQLGEWIYGTYAWMLFCLVLLIFGGLIILSHRPRYARQVARSAARTLLFLANMPVSVRGLEKLPSKPHILLLNHTSFLDPVVLVALLPARPGYAFTTRQQYRRQALFWPLLKPLGTIIFRHTAPPHSSPNLALLADALRQGENLIVFPEGGFGPQPGLQAFHTGAFVVAETEKVPVVVAGLRGARNALRLGTWRPRRTAITLEIGPVFLPGGIAAESPQQLREQARQAMQALTGESDSFQ